MARIGRLRWPLRFKLSSLLLLVTVLCLWMGYETYRARRQARIVTAIEESGFVVFEHRFSEQSWLDEHSLQHVEGHTVPPVPEWILNLLGPHYFVKPRSVMINCTDHPATTFRDVCSFGDVKEFWAAGIGDEEVVHLAKLKQLQKLDLILSPTVTDASVAMLGRLKTLATLNVSGTSISKEGVQQLQQLLPQTRIAGSRSQPQK